MLTTAIVLSARPRAARLAWSMIVVATAACTHDTRATASDEFERRANAVCEAAVAEMDAIVKPVIERHLSGLGEEPFTSEELQGFYRALLAPTAHATEIADQMFVTLRGLEASGARADDAAALWHKLESTLQRSNADVAEAANDPAAAIALWNTDVSPFADLDARAREVGLPGCTLDT